MKEEEEEEEEEFLLEVLVGVDGALPGWGVGMVLLERIETGLMSPPAGSWVVSAGELCLLVSLLPECRLLLPEINTLLYTLLLA